MAEKEPGRFRGNFLGGFNRKDVLTYIKSIYNDLDQAHMQNEDLRQRCIELENLLQNLNIQPEQPGPASPAFSPYPVAPAQTSPPSDALLYDPELISVLNSLPEPDPEPGLEPEPEPTPEPVSVAEPVPVAVPEPPPAPAIQKPSLAMPPTGGKKTRVKVKKM